MHLWDLPRHYQTCLRVVKSQASQDLICSSHPDCKVQFIFPMSCILQSAFAWPLPAALILALVTLTQANSADLIQRSFKAAGPKPWASGPGKLERPISLLNSDYKTLPNITRLATNICPPCHTRGYCSNANTPIRLCLVHVYQFSPTLVSQQNCSTNWQCLYKQWKNDATRAVYNAIAISTSISDL